ncbi:Uncharacterised protein [Vibrio cholerae]|nr:Uncharacterised protein [Vibrio cholerae]
MMPNSTPTSPTGVTKVKLAIPSAFNRTSRG